MPKPRRPLHDISDRLPCQHLLAPLPNRWPVLDVHSQELKHPRHREGEVREIGECGAVFERDVLLAGKGKALFKNVPLLDDVVVQPVASRGKDVRTAVGFQNGGLGGRKVCWAKVRTSGSSSEAAPGSPGWDTLAESTASTWPWP